MAKGYLIVNVYVDNIALPTSKASVRIVGDGIDVTKITNNDGQTEKIELDTISKDYSLENQKEIKPYKTYDLIVSKEGLCPKKVTNVEIFDNITSTQDVFLSSNDDTCKEEDENVEDIALWKKYPPYLLEEESYIAPYALQLVVVPEYIIVHDGIPTNNAAPNYTVNFSNYIKNVACSEIYSTWPKETIKANVIAIISFALNRIYTEWYKSKGYNFTITSTSSYDQKYTHNRTIFSTISEIVDDIFNTYIRVETRREPLLSQYRAETTTSGILSQWGSKDLGDKGYTAEKILKYYYGNDINLERAPIVSGTPQSFNGYTLKQGDCNDDIYIIQNQLNYIKGSYPSIPEIQNCSGTFNENTKNAVMTFQKIFGLIQSGNIDFATWYKISYIYVAVEKMTRGVYE